MTNNRDKFEYFMERTEQDLHYIRERIDQLWSFRMFLIGASTALSAITSIVVTLVVSWITQK